MSYSSYRNNGGVGRYDSNYSYMGGDGQNNSSDNNNNEDATTPYAYQRHPHSNGTAEISPAAAAARDYHHPSAMNYSPNVAAAPAATTATDLYNQMSNDSQQNFFVSALLNATSNNNAGHQHHHHHASSYQQQQPSYSYHQQQQPATNAYNSANHDAAPTTLAQQQAAAALAAFSAAYDPVPLPGLDSNTNQHHFRHSSFDDFMMMSPSLIAQLGGTPTNLSTDDLLHNVASNSNLAGLVDGYQDDGNVMSAMTASNGGLESWFTNTTTSMGQSSSQSALLTPVAEPTPSASMLAATSQRSVSLPAAVAALTLDVPAISLQPMLLPKALEHAQTSLDHVLSRYIPCVNFLVDCQQDLRKGLAVATQVPQQRHHHHHHRRSHRTMTARQFHHAYIEHLPQRFAAKNQYVMEADALQTATEALQKLRTESQAVELQGCEAVKNMFLGGMKEGESWGLRKWLSTHGNALSICTTLESVLKGLQKLDRKAAATQQAADVFRPLTAAVLQRLRDDIPATYQEHSAAHPFLPFFHRLEAVLRGLSSFNPSEEEVICLDDSDDDDDDNASVRSLQLIRHFPPAPKMGLERGYSDPHKKRKALEMPIPAKRFTQALKITTTPSPPAAAAAAAAGVTTAAAVPPRALEDQPKQRPSSTTMATTRTAAIQPLPPLDDDSSSSGESADASVVEIVAINAGEPLLESDVDDNGNAYEFWECVHCFTNNAMALETCHHCGRENFRRRERQNDDEFDEDVINVRTGLPPALQRPSTPETLLPFPAEVAVSTTPPVAAARVMWPAPIENPIALMRQTQRMMRALDHVAAIFEKNQQLGFRPPSAPRSNFWDGDRYGRALRLFIDLLRRSDSHFLVHRVDEDRLITAGMTPYSHKIKHPICLNDIFAAIVSVHEDRGGVGTEEYCAENGRLANAMGLATWNMWKGMDVLQAIDLVFLNALAYGKTVSDGKSSFRSSINRLRKQFWNGIQDIVKQHAGDDAERRKQYTPTRRSETSGFVVYKIQT